MGWPTQEVLSAVRLQTPRPGASAGTAVGQVLYALGSQIETVPLALSRTVPEPTWWWRLLHG
jgi:hypothetical protein